MGLRKTVFGKINSERPFIMQVEGASFTIPTFGTGYNYKIQTDDNQVFTGVTGDRTITFSNSGLHLIKITGAFPRIYFNNIGDKLKLKEVKQWGTNSWSSFQNAFYGCANLQVTSPDIPNLSNVFILDLMFAGCTQLNSPTNINTWNTSNIIAMSGMFAHCTAFNQSLNNWNVANVTGMTGMFSETSAFNQPLNSWNTSNVTDIIQIFYRATEFNQPLNSWNMSSVTNMGGVFAGATAFNQPLNSWNMSSVTNMGGVYAGMFAGATAFNQPLNSWNMSSVTNMEGVFTGATAFNQFINSWNTSNVTNMRAMFTGATNFNQPLSTNNVNNWNVANVTNMNAMFLGATAFNQDIGNWSVSNVTNMQNFMSTKTPATFSSTNLDAIYNGWGVQTVQFPNITFGSAKYTSAGASGKTQLLSQNCLVTDGGQIT